MSLFAETETPNLSSGTKDDELQKTLSQSLTEKVAQRLLNVANLGEIPNPDGYAFVRGDCGDCMEVFLAIQDRRIREARFDTLGCGFTIACGSIAMERAEGLSLSEAMRVSPQQISDDLGGLPASHFHCAELAAEALKKAVQDCLLHGNEPWKKLYRKQP